MSMSGDSLNANTKVALSIRVIYTGTKAVNFAAWEPAKVAQADPSKASKLLKIVEKDLRFLSLFRVPSKNFSLQPGSSNSRDGAVDAVWRNIKCLTLGRVYRFSPA
jgi:hypothetical protein